MAESINISNFSVKAHAWHLEIPLYIYATVFASFCVVTGLIWDISWHTSIGRDGLFSPPHDVVYLGAVVSGLFSGYQVLKVSFWGSTAEKGQNVNFWGVFYGSLGNLFSIWGALAMLTSAPFDDWWHNTYGLDVTILSPPHSILILGIIILQFGTMMGVLALQNLGVESKKWSTELLAKRNSRIQWLFLVSAGFAITMIYLLASENMERWSMHHSSFYQISAVIFPFFLVAVARASQLKWAITIVAVTYSFVMCLMVWVLPLFPAVPRLGPIYNFIDHYQPYHFPMLLVFPALAMDWLRFRFATKNDWVLAAILAIGFVIVLLATQYPFGDFLMSPFARNWIFGQNSWYFGNSPDWQYRFQFPPWMNQTPLDFLIGIGEALLFGYLSVRIGLFWGKWMKKVQR